MTICPKSRACQQLHGKVEPSVPDPWCKVYFRSLCKMLKETSNHYRAMTLCLHFFGTTYEEGAVISLASLMKKPRFRDAGAGSRAFCGRSWPEPAGPLPKADSLSGSAERGPGAGEGRALPNLDQKLRAGLTCYFRLF